MATEPIPSNRRILIVDDNESIHHDFRKILNPIAPGKSGLASAAAEIFGDLGDLNIEAPFEIDSAFQGQEALEMVRAACAARRPYAMAFVDLRMPPGWDGIETIGHLWSHDPHLHVVICTAYSDYSLNQIVGKLGRTDKLLILKKPFDSIEVRQFADALTEKWRLAREARAKMENLEERVAQRTRELHERQQELYEARKLELVGKLAGGIAHDFNSLLTSIIGHASLILQDSPPDSLPFRSAAEIGKSAASAGTLTHQLLAFSRKQMLRIERLDINATLALVGPSLRVIAGKSIELTTFSLACDPWAMGDAAQLQQVLASLVHNARHAMPQGGKIFIETADASVAPADPGCDFETRPGDYLMISVTDTGSGIPDEVKPHLFEPFFTTKAVGEGKGLGLAVCYGVLKQMGGSISVQSEPGHGATFKIYLPRLRQPGPDGNGSQPLSTTSSDCTGVILLVEENPALRDLAASVLENQGYTVRRVSSPLEAMNAASRLDHIDLLLADTFMPQMSGQELAESLSSTRPAMKVLLTSASEDPLLPDPSPAILHKPYTPTTLSQKTRQVLDAPCPLPAIPVS